MGDEQRGAKSKSRLLPKERRDTNKSDLIRADNFMDHQQEQPATYIMGHSESELQRLIDQSQFLSTFTEQALLAAGFTNGMRVLDVGCGPGDVSFLAAKLIGPSGTVIGVDKSTEAIALARKRASAAKFQNVIFTEGDVADLSLEQAVDAAVGRLILIHLPDPVAILRRVASHVRPGGVIAFQEMDMNVLSVRSLPYSPLYEQCLDWVKETLRQARVEMHMGLKLYSTFVDAGLPAPQMNMGMRVEGGPDSPVYEYVANTVRTLLPVMDKFGVARAEEVQIETLAQRLRDEVVYGAGVIVLPPHVSAWTRVKESMGDEGSRSVGPRQ
jgi:ubiquinone/menaquinone biosynthesis C-methylase UbiE